MTKLPNFAFSLRDEITPADREPLRKMVADTGYFHPEEVDVAVELVDERLAKGPPSGYYFVVAEDEGRMLGYVCYGPIACTLYSYDLYWIVVDRSAQGRGLGQLLMRAAEERVREAGGRRLYVDTSNKEQYASTRAFYQRCGYRQEAVLPDFFAPGDDKVIFARDL